MRGRQRLTFGFGCLLFGLLGNALAAGLAFSEERDDEIEPHLQVVDGDHFVIDHGRDPERVLGPGAPWGREQNQRQHTHK